MIRAMCTHLMWTDGNRRIYCGGDPVGLFIKNGHEWFRCKKHSKLITQHFYWKQ